MYQVGLGKAQIQTSALNVGMLGYALANQRVQGTRHPLYVRAFVVAHPESETRIVYAVGEVCFITLAVRQAVIEKLQAEYAELGLNAHNVMLTATHTHASPAGYSHFLFYNLTAPGFVPEVFDAIVDAFVSAIVGACTQKQAGAVSFAQSEMPAHQRVAFNRSVDAYNQNPEVTPVPFEARNEAVDRRMMVLRFDAADGTPLGMFSFFAVHGTSLHANNLLIDSDNKGVAARQMEQRVQRDRGVAGFVAGFAQTTAGDVSPNHRWDAKRGLMCGEFDDDEQSTNYNGTLQFEWAHRLFEAALQTPVEVKPLRSRIHYRDHGQIAVDPEFADGREGQHTVPGDIGLSMIMGTAEGRGPLFAARPVVDVLNRLSGLGQALMHRMRDPHSSWDQTRYRGHGPRFSFLDVAKGPRGRCFYIFNQGNPILPGFVDPGVARVRHVVSLNALGDAPWTPQIIPIQLMTLGQVAFAGLPLEPTTIAGRRLVQTLAPRLAPLGVKNIIVAGYANGYVGYVTTHQEYALQAYEGGSTHFGAWTLAGFQTRFDALAKTLAAADWSRENTTGEAPYRVNPRELRLRSYDIAMRAYPVGRSAHR